MGIGLVLKGGQAHADANGTDFESFVLGEVQGQDGWTSGHGSSSCPVYDVAVVSNTYGYAAFGTKSLRISNAITCGSYNDQTFSKSLTDEAGEASAPTSPFSGGTRQPYFEAQWDFASTVPGSEQPGLSVVASPDRGDTMRMSWLEMQDTPTGLQLNFQDYSHSLLNFVLTPIAIGLDRTVPHTVKISMNFIDGASNDVVKIYLDGVLIHTGTSWEDYYRDFAGGVPFPVDSIMFRVAGTAFPENSGKGFVIDNFRSFSGPLPALAQPADPIPTLSEWAMILLAALLAPTGFAAIRMHAR
jgi:IPTL-CTERM motif